MRRLDLVMALSPRDEGIAGAIPACVNGCDGENLIPLTACATRITRARSQVSGHEFTHAVQRKEKNNSLLPQAPRAAQRSDKKEAERSGTR
jgi:hypothetical protein